jgi:5,10-methylenetetrahydromethanopterin reductase
VTDPDRPLEVWSLGVSIPRWSAAQATVVEDLGFDGMTFSDSQNISADPYVTMMAVAAVTSTLKLQPSVTNPVTRDAAVTACAIASVQAETKGRAVLGIGRGDSALAHIGLAPAGVRRFEDYVRRVQSYLRGEAVEFDRDSRLTEGVKVVATLGMTNAPVESRMSWIRPSTPKVPVIVAASGPKVIDAAARVADGINFALGVDPERIKWAIDRAKAARAAAGLDPAGLSFGIYVSVVPEPDLDLARRLISGDVASFARFSVMHGTAVVPTSEASKQVMQEIHRTYDMEGHFSETSSQAQVLTPEFIDSYAIVGDPGRCVDRICELLPLGVTRLMVSTSARGADRDLSAQYRREFARSVLPALRAAA